MTRSPLNATLIPLIPLAALGLPLAQVLNQPAYQATELISPTSGPHVNAYLEIDSAHPFETLSVRIGEASWHFAPGEDEKEIIYQRDSELTLLVSATWPENTPKTALRLELIPDATPSKTHTLWGLGKVTEEVTFIWEDQE